MISIGLFLIQFNREILRNPLLISDIIRTEYEQGYAQCSDKPDVNDQPIGRGGWVRGRYHMALSLNEAREPDCRFYRSAPASRFDALAITIHLSRCNGVPSREYSRINVAPLRRPFISSPRILYS